MVFKNFQEMYAFLHGKREVIIPKEYNAPETSPEPVLAASEPEQVEIPTEDTETKIEASESVTEAKPKRTRKKKVDA